MTLDKELIPLSYHQKRSYAKKERKAKLLNIHFYPILFIFLFLLASTDVGMVEAGVCDSIKGGVKHGRACVRTENTGNCHNQCRNREGARSGACHAQFPGFAVF